MNRLLLAAFMIAVLNTAYHLGQNDSVGALVSGAIAAGCWVVGFATANK